MLFSRELSLCSVHLRGELPPQKVWVTKFLYQYHAAGYKAGKKKLIFHPVAEFKRDGVVDVSIHTYALRGNV